MFAEDLDYKEYAVQMQKLIDRHVGSNEVRQITPLVDIFDKDQFEAEVEKLASPAARADTIAHRTARTITERMDEDPVFYQRLSAILRRMIDDYQAQRIAAAEYLKRAKQVAEEARTHGMSKVPPVLRDHVPALAFYNTLQKALLGEIEPAPDDVFQLSTLALEIAPPSGKWWWWTGRTSRTCRTPLRTHLKIGSLAVLRARITKCLSRQSTSSWTRCCKRLATIIRNDSRS